MNMHSQTDIDRAISAACDLHDDRGLQTGTRRPDRQRPPQTLLDAHEGDAGLDVVADEDRGAAWRAATLGHQPATNYLRICDTVRGRHTALGEDDALVPAAVAPDCMPAELGETFLCEWGRFMGAGDWVDAELATRKAKFRISLLALARRVARTPQKTGIDPLARIAADWFIYFNEPEIERLTRGIA